MSLVTKAEYRINVIHRAEPEWKSDVERWYQMDATCFSVNQAAYQFFQEHRPNFENLILGITGGSNLADFDFVNSKCSSPAKFVYTLPNIALSTVCQMLKWSGPSSCIICRENDTNGVISEALESAKFESRSVLLFITDQLVQDQHLRVLVQHIGKN